MQKQFKLWRKAQELAKLEGKTHTDQGTEELFRIIDMAIAQGKEDELESMIQEEINQSK